MADPWLNDVQGTEVLPLITSNDPVIRVEAGPGTGKTFGLVRRVQRLLHPDGGNVPGSRVLVVAFNRVIAKQLQDDIASCLRGSPHDGEPVVRTVHALCLETIGEPLRLLLPHEYDAMVYDVLEQHPKLRKAYGTFPNAQQALRDHEAEHATHSALMHAAEAWLTRHHATLISKIPLLVLQTLRSGEQPKHEYDHVFVDEFQDLSPSEHELFVRLRGTSGSLLVLGDPRQSIYAFRGNDRDGLNKLPALIRGSGNAITDVPMSECRRCPEVIVRAANELTNLYPSGPMISTNPTPGNVHVITWRSPNQEAAGMARAVVENVTRFPTQSHLVMVTRRHFGYQLREQIYALNPELRVDLSFSESLLEEWIPREAFLFFCLLADPDAPTWRSWLGYRDAPPAESPTAPARNAPAYLHFLGACDDEVTEGKVMLLSQEDRDRRRGGGGLNLWDRAHRFRTLLESVDWRSLSPEQLADSAFEAPRWAPRPSVDQQTALLDLQAIRDRCQSLLREYRILRPHLDEHELVAGVARQIRYQIATREPFVLGDDVDISVSTMWGAKGVTADNVYIVGLVDEAIPGAKRDEYPGTDLDFVEEQRRLFYVSLTRSRRTLVLSRFQNSIRRTTALKLGLRVPPGSSEWVRVTPCRFLVDAMSILPNGVPGASWHGCGD